MRLTKAEDRFSASLFLQLTSAVASGSTVEGKLPKP